jgi:hypothetical protein
MPQNMMHTRHYLNNNRHYNWYKLYMLDKNNPQQKRLENKRMRPPDTQEKRTATFSRKNAPV